MPKLGVVFLVERIALDCFEFTDLAALRLCAAFPDQAIPWSRSLLLSFHSANNFTQQWDPVLHSPVLPPNMPKQAPQKLYLKSVLGKVTGKHCYPFGSETAYSLGCLWHIEHASDLRSNVINSCAFESKRDVPLYVTYSHVLGLKMCADTACMQPCKSANVIAKPLLAQLCRLLAICRFARLFLAMGSMFWMLILLVSRAASLSSPPPCPPAPAGTGTGVSILYLQSALSSQTVLTARVFLLLC